MRLQYKPKNWHTTTTVSVTPSHCSDHHMVAARLSAAREKRRVREVTIRSTRSLVPDALRLDLLLADWSGMREAVGVEEKWSAWRDVWSPVIDRHMPLITIRPRHPPCPWLTDNDDVRALMGARDLARQECESDPSPETRDAYRVSREQARSAQARARSDFFATSFRNSRRHTWKDVQRYLISSRKTVDTERGTSACTDRPEDALLAEFTSLTEDFGDLESMLDLNSTSAEDDIFADLLNSVLDDYDVTSLEEDMPFYEYDYYEVYSDFQPPTALPFSMFGDMQPRPPSQGDVLPSSCAWAVVQCCSNPDKLGSRVSCFSHVGCYGSWIQDFCTPEIKRVVFKSVFKSMKFSP
ncbi:hypothetical protein FJT64_020529 [Amphibalanus amphitrite]|uniref:Uncharacterized protein n=1 Tax=Amphibalanus amphitrite TaxID=1232801 RepID=A0A6A4WN43_AMPAM|nr:hypothetical protein FJT64_020529 [Amphibalanus amphitrite]